MDPWNWRWAMDQLIERRRWGARRIVYLSVAIALVGWLGWGVLSAGRGPRLRVPRERVRIATVVRGEFQEYLPLTGTLVPRTTHYLDAAEGGRVETVRAEAGGFVAAGDTILVLANANLMLDVMYREAELFQQRNNLRNAKIALEQNRLQLRRELLDVERDIAHQQRERDSYAALAAQDLIARQEYEDVETELDYLLRKRELILATQAQDSLYRTAQIQQLEESLLRIQTNLEFVNRNLGNLVVRAPVAGQLTSLDAEIGQSKDRGERLGQIDMLDGFKVRSRVDQFYIARVFPGLAGLVEIGGLSCRLVADKVYPEVESGGFDIELRFENEEPGEMRRGQTFPVRLQLGDPLEALILPLGPFHRDTGGRWVYVLAGDGRQARRREIQLGRRNAEACEVLEGLEEGDRVIVSSYENLGDASLILLVD
jgi:HlyD family secretion protein